VERATRFAPSLSYLLPLFFFLLAALPAAVIGIMLTRDAWRHELQQAEQLHQKLAQHMAHALSRYAKDVEATFQFAVSHLTTQQPLHTLPTLLERLHFHHVCLVKTTGHIEQRALSPTTQPIERFDPHFLATLFAAPVHSQSTPIFSSIRLDDQGQPTLYILTMHDTGGGISPATLARIFEPLFTTKKARQGAGMGLAIVHGIVASHSGVVTMQSTTTDGTTFVLYFPQVGEHPTPTDMPHRLAVHGSEHLLFVDDEADTALAMQELLAHLGYETVVCTTSIEALSIFRAAPQRFDLVITDQTMPKMTGKTLAQELRRIRPDVPIILCTGFSHIIDAAEAEALGIDAFLMKPLAIGDLSHTIQDVLARRTA
jgi:CheY-like chemotaxis protein